MTDICPVCGKGRFGKFKSEPEEDRHYLVSHLDCVLKVDASLFRASQRAEQAEAEVERLRWMLDEAAELAAICTGREDETKTTYLADLERRWEERNVATATGVGEAWAHRTEEHDAQG